jgi:general secretion pathway protein D
LRKTLNTISNNKRQGFRMNKMLLLTLTSLMITDATAQNFSRFKDKTDFNPSDKKAKSSTKKSATSLVKTQGTSGTKDSFGRARNNDPKLKKADTFVNLNPETAFGPEVITDFNYVNATLEELTNDMQKLTGINLIIAGQGSSIAGKGKITLTTSTPITVGEAWRAYLTVLSNNGFTLVKSGAFYKIVNNRDIRYTPTKVYTGNYTPDTDNYAMRILPLKNIDAKEVVRSFRPFMSRYGRIMPLEQTNTILIQDTGSNINRLVRLIKFTDVPGFEESLQIIPVENTSAQEIAKLLDQILKGNSSSKFKSKSKTAKTSPISKIIAEPRTNTIIAMTNSDGARQLKDLIKKLDVKHASRGGGRIHIYHLQHGTAETLAQTLSSLVGSSSGSKSSRSRRSTLRRSAVATSSSSSSLFSDEVKITADKENNAIVVTASPTDYLTLKEVISKLDTPRDQVFVEGLMMETNVEKVNNFGISIVSAYGTGNVQRGGFGEGDTATNLLGLLTGTTQSLSGFFTGVGLGKKVTVGEGDNAQTINTINGLIQAIARDTNTNVLATPQILALDNTEATFEVGETVPTTETATANNVTTTSNSTQQVKLTLKITPQINKVTRFVKLKINQNIEDFSDRPVSGGNQSSGVATTVRSADTTVVVRDKDTIAMGGLMRDKETHIVGKVPLLGDIPVLGWLFRNTQKRITKVNMLFFLTPRILANYQRDNAKNVKDLLNRRKSHLESAIGEDDPFGTTTKGLYEKAKKQEKGPLYDEDDRRRYHNDNEDGSGIGNNKTVNNKDIPNYKNIMQTVKMKNSGVKK